MPRLRIRFSALALTGVERGCFEAWLVVQEANAAALGPPIHSRGIELLLQASGCPSLQVDAYLSRMYARGGNNGMHVIRSAIDGIKAPATVAARFGDLPCNGVTLRLAQATCVLGHFRRRFQFPHRVGKLPAMPVLDPTPAIARQPRAVRDPGQEISNRIVHHRGITQCVSKGIITRRVSKQIITRRVSKVQVGCGFIPRLRFGLQWAQRVVHHLGTARRVSEGQAGRGMPVRSSLTLRVTMGLVSSLTLRVTMGPSRRGMEPRKTAWTGDELQWQHPSLHAMQTDDAPGY